MKNSSYQAFSSIHRKRNSPVGLLRMSRARRRHATAGAGRRFVSLTFIGTFPYG